MRKATYSFLVITLFFFSLVGAMGCGGGSSDDAGGGDDTADDDTTDDTDDDGGTTATVTLSGQVAVRASDVAGLSLGNGAGLKASSVLQKPKFETIGDTVLASANVALVKIQVDGTESTEATATTDTEGNYTLADVPVCQTSTGTTSDFYYEIQVTSGDVTVTAPACPSEAVGDETVDVSPESDLAAKIISDVVDVPGTDDNPVPSAAVFAEVLDLTAGNVAEIEESISIPELSDTEGSVDMANGMAAAGGDAEEAYKKFQFESEFVLITAGADISTDEAGSYLARVAKEGCESSSAALPQAAAEALADAVTSGTTFTPTEIVTALNEVNGPDPDVDTAAKVTEYAAELAAIEEGEAALDALVTKLAVIGEETDLGAFLTKRDLTAADFSADTELAADQAVTFLETLANQSCNFGNTSMTQVVAALTGSDALGDPAIDQAVIYNDSGFGCDAQQGRGHFIATVDVYLPAGDPRTINSVVITSTSATALGGDGTITLTQSGPATHFVSQTDPNAVVNPANCVTIDEEVTYTITATLSDSSTATKEVVRTHPETLEAVISLDGTVIGNNSVAVATNARPLISWTAPEDVLAAYDVTPPEGSQVKYTYELSYYQRTNTADVDSSNDTALAMPGCQFAGNTASLYATNSMIPLDDCDVAACATAVGGGVTADKIYCRINIQTYLFDAYDQQQSQAAGAFRYFCVDTSATADGDCGD